MKKQVRTKKCKITIGSNVAQMEQTANFRMKMIQPRTTGPYHKFFQTFCFFLFRLKLFAEVSDIFWPSNFSPFLLARTGADSFSSSAWGLARCSQDAVNEDGHDGSADQARDGNCHKPRHEDVSEQTPVYSLSWTQPSYSNHRAHLETH